MVSNAGDDTLTIFDVKSLQVTATIAGVPAAGGLHGIAVTTGRDATNGNDVVLAWVAATEGNLITVVDLVHGVVRMQIPLTAPTALAVSAAGDIVYAASSGAGAGEIIAYDAATMTQVNNQFQSLPAPRDFVFSPLLGDFAISGPDALWKFDPSSPAGAGPVGVIPGATALAAPDVANLGRPVCCAMLLGTSTENDRVYLIQAAPALPSEFTVQNAGSFAQSGAAPGSLASIVPVTTGVTQDYRAASVPLPAELAGVSVNIGENFVFDATTNRWVYSAAGARPATLLYAGPNQINFQVPYEIGLGKAVRCRCGGQTGRRFLGR